VYRLLTAAGRIAAGFSDAAGNPVYAPEHERILGKGARATARQQAVARARTSSLGVAYSLSMAMCFVVMALDQHAAALTGQLTRCGNPRLVRSSRCGAGPVRPG